MRTALAYTSARFVLFLVALVLLYVAGARGLLLAALALLVSGIASFVLLSRQRDVMSGALTNRLRGVRTRARRGQGPGSAKAPAPKIRTDAPPRPSVRRIAVRGRPPRQPPPLTVPADPAPGRARQVSHPPR